MLGLGPDVVDVGGFLAAAVVAAVELLFTLVGEPALEASEAGAAEVRRAVPVSDETDARGFFSSSDPEAFPRFVAVVVVLGATRFVAVVAAGRVGALLKPAVPAGRAAEPVVVLVAVVGAATGRRAVRPVVAVRFAPATLGEGLTSGLPFEAAEAGAGAAGASACWTTSNPSASDMMGDWVIHAGWILGPMM